MERTYWAWRRHYTRSAWGNRRFRCMRIRCHRDRRIRLRTPCPQRRFVPIPSDKRHCNHHWAPYCRRRSLRPRRGCGVAGLSRGAIRVGIASANVTRRITKAAGARSARTHTSLSEFDQTNAVATIAIRLIAIVATLGSTFGSITTDVTAERPAGNGIGKLRIESPANRSAGAIGSEGRAVVRRPAIIIGWIGRVEPSSNKVGHFDRPIDEEIGRAAEHAGRRNCAGVSNRGRERIDGRRQRNLRGIRGIIRRRRHGVFVEVQFVRVGDPINERRILECSQIRVGVDETTPTKRLEVGGILQGIGIHSKAEEEVICIRRNVEHRIRCIADDIA
jgi:hypothetical protein